MNAESKQEQKKNKRAISPTMLKNGKSMMKFSRDLGLHLWTEAARYRRLIQDSRWQVSLIETVTGKKDRCLVSFRNP